MRAAGAKKQQRYYFISLKQTQCKKYYLLYVH
jgi:hypothetical protein